MPTQPQPAPDCSRPSDSTAWGASTSSWKPGAVVPCDGFTDDDVRVAVIEAGPELAA